MRLALDLGGRHPELAVLAASSPTNTWLLDDERRQSDQVASRAAELEQMLDLALGLADSRPQTAAR